HFVRHGRLVLEYKDHQVHLKKGDIFCLYPNISYTYYRPAEDIDIEEKEPLKLCWLAVDGTETESMLKLTGIHPHYPIIHGNWGKQLDEQLSAIYRMLRMRKFLQIDGYVDLKGKLYGLFAT